MKNRVALPGCIRGFSIVELMVAITIGLIIMAAVSTIFVNSKTSYTTQESMARLQESARVAMNFVSKDLRLAGYYGCFDDMQNLYSVLQSSAGAAYNFSVAVEGVEGDTGTLYPSNVAPVLPTSATAPAVTSKYANCPNYVGGKCTGTDAIAIRTSDPASFIPLIAAMPNKSAIITVSAGAGFQTGDIVLVSDCGGADLVQITSVTNTSGTQTLDHVTGSGTPGNRNPPDLSRPYGPPGGEIRKFVNRFYYVGTGTSGYPTLFRQTISGTNREELIEGIQDMQVTYGLANSGIDRTPRAYLPANDASLGNSTANWANVVSARLIFTSIPINTSNPSAPVNASSTTLVQPKQFTSTVLLRNVQ